MSWYNTGYDATESAWDDVSFDDGKKNERFFIPWPDPKKNLTAAECTKRLLFLDDEPASFWEHQFSYKGDFRHLEVCLARNKALKKQYGGDCPPCEKIEGKYPYFIGLHTVIVMTPFFAKKTNVEYCFTRKIFAAKLGGKDKPGVLVKLRKLREKHGRLRGLIFDVERPGKMTEVCGSEFDLVTKIEPDKIKTYCMEQMNAYAERRNSKLSQDKQVTVEKLLEWHPWEPWDWDQKIQPKSLSDLNAMFSQGGGYEVDDKSNFSDDDDSGKGADPVEDDVPY
jgi:hypothetical protein